MCENETAQKIFWNQAKKGCVEKKQSSVANIVNLYQIVCDRKNEDVFVKKCVKWLFKHVLIKMDFRI